MLAKSTTVTVTEKFH